MSKERLEEIEAKYSTLTVSSERDGTEYTEVDVEDLVFMIQNGFKQAERVQELEKERSEWKGKYSVLKNKYRALQRKTKNRWRYNRALENESRTNEIVLEEFREENKRYRGALEEIRGLYPLRNVGYQVSEIRKIVIKALEGEE